MPVGDDLSGCKIDLGGRERISLTSFSKLYWINNLDAVETGMFC
jgi:hypothetical protein